MTRHMKWISASPGLCPPTPRHDIVGWIKRQSEKKNLYFVLIRSPPMKVFTVQFSSVAQSCSALCDPMDYSKPDLSVYHQLLGFTQTHVHWVSDAIQPSHPLSYPSPHTYNLSKHQGLFKWVSSSHQVDKLLEFQLQHQSFQWTPRTDLL